MTAAEKNKNYFPWILFSVSFFINILIIVWALTQKVEADRQRNLADVARNEAFNNQRQAESAKYNEQVKSEELRKLKEELAELKKK